MIWLVLAFIWFQTVWVIILTVKVGRLIDESGFPEPEPGSPGDPITTAQLYGGGAPWVI
jgi:hypothetical protein